MNVLSKLQDSSVDLVSDHMEGYRFRAREPISFPTAEREANPQVSCLMVTRGNLELLKYSLACYRRQTYPNRELVIVTAPEAGEKVNSFIAEQELSDVIVCVAPPGLTLGDHRNLAAARAGGWIVATWDDDDLCDPMRLQLSVQALRQTDTMATILARLLLWWPQRKLAAISQRRVWEQSMVTWRYYLPIYPSLPRNEDLVTRSLVNRHKWAALDCPLLYIYAVTGRNTWDVAHFEGMFSRAECCFAGDEFDELNRLLSDRLPVLDYAAVLTEACTG
jgi:glycosyltransferase involved in cell wall biosynthesis